MKSAKEKERELIIKLSTEKKSSYQISAILGISQSKASFWIRRYRNTRSLKDKPRSGRPTELNKDKLDKISSSLKERLVNQTQRAGLYSKELLVVITKETGRKYTLRHAERLLHKMGFSLITPRVSHIRKDEVAQEKFRSDFKKNLNRNIWAIKS